MSLQLIAIQLCCFWRHKIPPLDKFKVDRYSFSWSIPPKFGIAIHRHKQRFGIIITTMVLDKDENCYDQGCNDIRVVIATKWRHYLLAAVFLGTGSCSSKIVHKNKRFFPKIAALMFVKFISGICKSVIEICRDEVFMIKNKKNGK